MYIFIQYVFKTNFQVQLPLEFWPNVIFATMILAWTERPVGLYLIGITNVFVLQDFMAKIVMLLLMPAMEILVQMMLNVMWWKLEDFRKYSCNNITTTWIQISRQNWNGFFSNASHQIKI